MILYCRRDQPCENFLIRKCMKALFFSDPCRANCNLLGQSEYADAAIVICGNLSAGCNVPISVERPILPIKKDRRIHSEIISVLAYFPAIILLTGSKTS